MSVQVLLDRARASLEGTIVNADDFLKRLAALFGYESPANIKEEELKFAKWEDLEKCGLPLGKARQIADIFRSDEPVPVAQPTAPTVVNVISDDPEVQAKSLSPAELIARADLTKGKRDAFATRLDDLADKRRFVVYNRDGSKNVEKTLELFEQLEDYGEKDTIVLEGVPAPVYYVGDRPTKVVDEHPLQAGKALRPDSDWNKVDTRIRQLLFVAVTKTKELDPDEYHEIDIVAEATEKGFEYLAQKYERAAVELQKMESTGKAPALKITVQSSRVKGGKVTDGSGNVVSNNPFTGRNRET